MQVCNAMTPTDAQFLVGRGAKFGKSQARIRLAQRLCLHIDDQAAIVGAFRPHQCPFESMCGF
jgi:hypothetical protein